jgi:hypothetical protein
MTRAVAFKGPSSQYAISSRIRIIRVQFEMALLREAALWRYSFYYLKATFVTFEPLW